MSEELWYVKLANGDVHRVTLDQLDGAFQAGHIDESTMVLAAGAETWTRLGDLAGLDDESSPPAPQPASLAPAAQAHSIERAPARITSPVQHVAPYVAPVQVAAYTPPRTVSAAAPPPYVANSLRPMSMDLEGDDLDMPFRRTSSKKGWVIAALGLLLVAGGTGMAANRGLNLGKLQKMMGGGSSDLANAAAAAAVAAPRPVADPVVVAPPPVVAAPVPPAPVAAAPAHNAAPQVGEGSPLNPQFTTRLNEDTKVKLAAADKTREQKSKARHGGGGAPRAASKAKSTTFTTGGNKYDPLNSSI